MCNFCNDTKEILIEGADGRGEFYQQIVRCDCTLKKHQICN